MQGPPIPRPKNIITKDIACYSLINIRKIVHRIPSLIPYDLFHLAPQGPFILRLENYVL